MADPIDPQTVYAALLQINQALADIALSLSKIRAANVESTSNSADLVRQVERAVPAAVAVLAEAIKSMPAPKVTFQAPQQVAVVDHQGDSWVIKHQIDERTGNVTQSVIVRTPMGAVAGMTKQ